MRVLGIDPSLTATTLCILDSYHDLPTHSLFTITTKAKNISRLMEIEHNIKETLKLYQPDVVCIEGYSFGSRGKSVYQIGELGGIIRRCLHVNNKLWYEIPPTVLKKFATGSGNATKESVVLHVYKKWGVECKSNDQADAFVLAMIGLNLYSPTTLTQYQKQIISKIERKI